MELDETRNAPLRQTNEKRAQCEDRKGRSGEKSRTERAAAEKIEDCKGMNVSAKVFEINELDDDDDGEGGEPKGPWVKGRTGLYDPCERDESLLENVWPFCFGRRSYMDRCLDDRCTMGRYFVIFYQSALLLYTKHHSGPQLWSDSIH